jgi:hypothetical protein
MVVDAYRQDHLPVSNRLISREIVMKMLPAGVLSAALFAADVTANVSGYLPSRVEEGASRTVSRRGIRKQHIPLRVVRAA